MEIYEVAQDRTSVRRLLPVKPFEKPIGRAVAERVKLGKNLYVHLALILPVPPAKKFPVRKFLAYDLRDLDKPADSPGLRNVARNEGLVYETPGTQFNLPTFALQDPGEQLRVLQASCRKLHSDGSDALASAEGLLSATSCYEPFFRFSALFFTGDQIYADDVSQILIKDLISLGEELTGRQEEIERPKGAPLVPRVLRTGNRAKAIKEDAGFTSTEAENHLMTFGEFSAMYLLCFNEDNWPETLKVPSSDKKYLKEKECLEDARRSLKSVRRLLANIPTYMMFDDHDVTDDWNLNSEWLRRVKDSPTGRRIVANALAAYWAFQGWGNNPDAFDKKSFIQPIENYLGLANPSKEAAAAFEDALWSFHDWAFYAPTNPPAFFMDTRTNRSSTLVKGQDPRTAPPRLVDDNGWNKFTRTIQRDAKHRPGDPLILIAATPLFNLQAIDLVQSLAQISYSLFTFLDVESWRANSRNMVDFFQFVFRLGPRPCVILSGDVHFATAAAATLDLQDTVAGGRASSRSLKLAQLTSSATKNSNPEIFRAIRFLESYLRATAPPAAPGITKRYWWPSGSSADSEPERIIQEAINRRPPAFSERIRFVDGKLLPETLFDHNVGVLDLNARTLNHRFLTVDGREHIAARFDLEQWYSD